MLPKYLVQVECAYGTHHELQFLSALGKHSDLNIPKKDLIAGYLKGCEKRVNWGAIDRDVVIAKARGML